MDIGRQRHLAQRVQDLLKHPVIPEVHHSPAKFRAFQNLGLQLSRAKCHLAAGFQPPAWAHQGFPQVLFQALQQQHLTGHAAVHFDSDQPGGDHLGVVDHHRVTGPQVFWQIKKMPVCPVVIVPIAHQHAAGVPGLHRRLGDQAFRQIIIKIMGFHQRMRPVDCLACQPQGRGGQSGCRRKQWPRGPGACGG